MKKFVAALLLLTVVLTALSSCFEASAKDFSKAGMTITLNENFYEKEYVSYTAVYESADIAVYALKEEKSLFEQYGYKNLSLTEYGNMVLEANKLTANTISRADGLSFFTYEKQANGKDFYYKAYIFEVSDAFWLVQFACMADKKDTYDSVITEYAKSIKFE